MVPHCLQYASWVRRIDLERNGGLKIAYRVCVMTSPKQYFTSAVVAVNNFDREYLSFDV